MRLTHLTAADYKRMPWKNAGGITTELLAEPQAGGGFLWRLSIAEVAQSGPFSDFTGYDRTIMLLDGAGFTLSFPGSAAKRLDQPLQPFRFPGEWQTKCTLINGGVRDFNLIAARNGPKAALEVVHLAAGASRLPAATTVIAHVIDGRAVLAGRKIDTGDTLRIDGADPTIAAVATAPSILAVIRIGA